MEFFPTKKQTEEYLKSVFLDKGLSEVVKLHKAQASHEAKRELTQVIMPFLLSLKNAFGTVGKHFIRFVYYRKNALAYQNVLVLD